MAIFHVFYKVFFASVQFLFFNCGNPWMNLCQVVLQMILMLMLTKPLSCPVEVMMISKDWRKQIEFWVQNHTSIQGSAVSFRYF